MTYYQQYGKGHFHKIKIKKKGQFTAATRTTSQPKNNWVTTAALWFTEEIKHSARNKTWSKNYNGAIWVYDTFLRSNMRIYSIRKCKHTHEWKHTHTHTHMQFLHCKILQIFTQLHKRTSSACNNLSLNLLCTQEYGSQSVHQPRKESMEYLRMHHFRIAFLIVCFIIVTQSHFPIISSEPDNLTHCANFSIFIFHLLFLLITFF